MTNNFESMPLYDYRDACYNTLTPQVTNNKPDN